MAKAKFEVGKLYKVRFYDHCIGSKSEMECEVCGWIIKQDDVKVVLTYWHVDTEDTQVKRDNIEPITLIKSCIIRKRKLS